MTYKVCIVCDKIIAEKDRVDYDVFASFFKYDSGGSIIGMTDKHIDVFFHKKCFLLYRKLEKKKHLYFTQKVGSKRIIIKDMN